MVATIVCIVLVAIVFNHIGFVAVKDCFALLFKREYWTDYNIVDALAWATKASVIIPGLIYGVQIWQLYFLTLATSLALIWSSHKKLLPSLVAFNTIWAWISCMVLSQHLL